MTSTSLVKSENLCRNSQHGKINGTSAVGQIPVCNGQLCIFFFLLLAKPQMYSISTVHWSAQEHIICNYCLQTAKKQNTKNTGGRDLINFKNTHSDKQSPENKSARPVLPLSLHLLFLGVCLLQTMVALHWGLYIGMIDEGICLTQGPVFSVPVPMSAHCSSASVVIHTNDKKRQRQVSCCCCC